MKIQKGEVIADGNKDIYWARIVFLSNDESQKTQILTCSSEEYLQSKFEISNNETINKVHLNKWLDSVIEKWSVLGFNIFDQNIHYDVYTLTESGENKGLEFLFNITR